MYNFYQQCCISIFKFISTSRIAQVLPVFKECTPCPQDFTQDVPLAFKFITLFNTLLSTPHIFLPDTLLFMTFFPAIYFAYQFRIFYNVDRRNFCCNRLTLFLCKRKKPNKPPHNQNSLINNGQAAFLVISNHF